MKFASLEAFEQYLENDLTWRKKELSALALLIQKNMDRDTKSAILRGALPVLYAHWEGFIKRATYAYLSYVSSLQLSPDQVSDAVLALALKTRIDQWIPNTGAKSSVSTQHIDAVRYMRSGGMGRINLVPKGVNSVDTGANLSSKVFKRLACHVEVDHSGWEDDLSIIDDHLLKVRNGIAHGEEDSVSPEQWEGIYKRVLLLMSKYSDAVLESALDERYKIA